MASYARAPSATKSQMSVLAQAKPAIISASNDNSNNNFHVTTGVLSEKIKTTLRFSTSTNNQQERDSVRFNFTDQKVKAHIEDDNVINNQNASNQMRQAAVLAAVASQQKVRLSATERLALTAKRPTTDQQMQQKQPLINGLVPPVPNNTKSASLPTLETLLAVQRQLQQHTKQNLTSAPQQVVTNTNNINSNNSNNMHQENANLTSAQQHQQRNKPLPPSPPKTPTSSHTINEQQVSQNVTYDKDLPPLPPSISPCESSDDSQMNSLDSHQSSPATSLVSIPPPPPPLSSYLQQYDEVNGSHQSLHSNSSLPSNSSISASSGISSVKQFPTLQVKSISNSSNRSSSSSFELPPSHYVNQVQRYDQIPQKLPALAPKPQLDRLPQIRSNNINYPPPTFNQNNLQNSNNNSINPSQPPPLPQTKPQLQIPPQLQPKPQANQPHQLVQPYGLPQHKPQINYQDHLFKPASCRSPCQPPPPPPLPNNATSEGFDEIDGDGFRFPTPPPPDLLLDDEICEDEEDDDDFQCKIPTPPPHKSMSSASFQDLHCQQQQQQQQQQLHQQIHHHQQQQKQSPVFNSSTFSVPSTGMASVLQPPPLFRQPVSQAAPIAPPSQLTVHINNEGGLLSTANHANLPTVNHHHHIMMTMTTSSSSPSSSSDGDGQSSNSSSSTSGIHSSIDSPSSSNSKLDDFNYSAKLKKQLVANHEFSHKNITSLPVTSSVTITNLTTTRRPALKQRKQVSFSDKVEMVACAEEQSEDHLPNPLLARVLAGKLQ